MITRRRTWRFTVKQADGTPLITLFFEREPIRETSRPAPSANGAESPSPSPSKQALATAEPRMTEPQRRYLFRLLAEQGVDGKQAEEHLRRHFHVASLRAISKTAASQLIEQMIADRKEVQNNGAA